MREQLRRRWPLGLAMGLAGAVGAACGSGPSTAAVAVTPAPEAAPRRELRPVAAPGAAAPLRIVVAGAVTAPSASAELSPLGATFASATAVVVGAPASLRGVRGADRTWLDDLAQLHVGALAWPPLRATGTEGAGRAAERAADELGVVVVGGDEEPLRARVLAADGEHRVCAVSWISSAQSAPRPEAGTRRGAVDGEWLGTLTRAIAEARRGGCDVVVALGRALPRVQSSIVEIEARAVARAGADAIAFLHGPGPGPLLVVDGVKGRRVPVFTSLGALDGGARGGEWERVGMLAELSFQWASRDKVAPLTLTYGYRLTVHEPATGGRRNGGAARKARGSSSFDAPATTRLFDPRADIELVRRLVVRRGAPAGIFDSPCFLAVGPGCH